MRVILQHLSQLSEKKRMVKICGCIADLGILH